MEIKKVRQIGLWVIVGVTLLILLGLNIAGNTSSVNIVATVSIIAIIAWLVAMAVWNYICRRH